MNQRKIQYWVIAPKNNAEYVAAMEDVLDVYSMPYNEELPVLVMDEQPIQLIKEVRTPLPGNKKHPKRVDYEYERAGTASIFMIAEPLTGWRKVIARSSRTKKDWAKEIEKVLNGRYRNAKKVILVCDNLNTHTKGAFYEAFEPEKARNICRRLEIHYTPKHGSWLNIAENELSALTTQCLSNRRFGSIEKLEKEITAWASSHNEKKKMVEWQFDIGVARLKLKSLYPNIIV